MTLRKALYLCAFGLLFSACNAPKEEVILHSFKEVWHKESPQVFEFEISDHSNPKNIIFVVRNNVEYPYLSLPIRMVLKKKKGVLLERLKADLPLSTEKGRWLGSGFGDTKESRFLIKESYRFAQNGIYVIEFRQNTMRPELIGIEDIGVIIQTEGPSDGK